MNLGHIVGSNARAIRLAAGKTAEDVAHSANKYGGNYSSATIGNFESGNANAATVKNLLLLAASLTDVTGHPVTLADLCAGDGQVTIYRLRIDLAALRDALQGHPVALPVNCDEPVRESDKRNAAKLGVSPADFAALARELWGHSFHVERNARAGADAAAQHRGQITRDLLAELRVIQRIRQHSPQ